MSASSIATTATSRTGSAPRSAKRASTVHASTWPSASVSCAAIARTAATTPTAASTRPRGTALLPRAQVRPALDEQSDEPRIQVAAGEALELGERALDRPRRLVGAVGDQRVVDVADRADARDERDLVALAPQRVAGAVPLLVVGARDDLAPPHDPRARAGEPPRPRRPG